MPERLQPPKWNTFVIVVTVPYFIERCLETLYQYTEKGSFYVYIIDQTITGLDATRLRDTYPNLLVIRTPKTYVHPTGNLGHSQGTNLGLSLVETPYVTLLNDDVEFVSMQWWQGVMDTFDKVEEQTPDRPAIMVNPASIKLPDWSVGRSAGDDFYIMPYKDHYTDEDWRHLVDDPHPVNEHLTLVPGSVIDGVNLYASVCDTKKLNEVGRIDDFWFPGNANDYDLSCRAGMYGYRCIGTTLSWVFHHWSKTFHSDAEMQALAIPNLTKGDLREKWGDRLDVWGVKCIKGEGEVRLQTKDGITATCPKHPDEIYSIPQNTYIPL